MLNITHKEVLRRWDELSPLIREALFSEENSTLITQIAGARKLTEDEANKVLITAGDVLMGFLPLDPLKIADELSERSSLDKQVAYEIVQELNRKIFSGLKPEIEQIGRVSSIKSVVESTNPDTNQEASVDSGLNRPKTMNEFKPSSPKTVNFESRPKDFINKLSDSPKFEKFNPDRFESLKVEPENDEPVMIHEARRATQEESINNLTGIKKNEERTPIVFQTFQMQDQNSQREKPVTVRIESSEDEDDVRVVHYNGLTTPVNKAPDQK